MSIVPQKAPNTVKPIRFGSKTSERAATATRKRRGKSRRKPRVAAQPAERAVWHAPGKQVFADKFYGIGPEMIGFTVGYRGGGSRRRRSDQIFCKKLLSNV